MMTSLPPILTSSLLLTTSALLARRHAAKHGPSSFARTLIRLNSILYTGFSAYMCLSIILYTVPVIAEAHSKQSLADLLSRANESPEDHRWRLIFHLSKFYEYVDIILVLWSGGSVGIHFGFHHLTTPYLTYARTLCKPGGWQIFAILNTFHHSIMYLYFAGVASLGAVLPVTGYLQLIVGIFVELLYILEGQDPLWPNTITLFLLSCYAILFAGDLRSHNETSDKVN